MNTDVNFQFNLSSTTITNYRPSIKIINSTNPKQTKPSTVHQSIEPYWTRDQPPNTLIVLTFPKLTRDLLTIKTSHSPNNIPIMSNDETITSVTNSTKSCRVRIRLLRRGRLTTHGKSESNQPFKRIYRRKIV